MLTTLALLGAAPAFAKDAPATVLRHEVVVTVDAAHRATTAVTWEVRIDDPAACAAGLIAPDGLDGATDGSATVLEDTLVIGPDTAAGTVFTLSAKHTTRHAGGQSGGFLTAPDLPVKAARLQLKVASSEPLHAWHDPTAVPDLGAAGVRSLDLRWTDVPPEAPAQAVWSTWPDWMAAGGGIAEQVDERIGDKKALGRELTDGYSGMHAADAFERVVYTVALDPHGPSDWSEARPASEVLAERRGSVVDRGVVLLSLLRLAGQDAEPGYYRPSTARGGFPVSVPAPAMLGRPVVVVHRDGGDVYLDLANESVAIPEVPAAMIGGVLWVPGDLPAPLVTTAATDGAVNLQGSVTVTSSGAASWTVELTASGTAQQALRELLAPLDEAGRTETLGRLVRIGRPGLERFAVTATGLEKTKNHVKITLSGNDTAAFSPLGGGQMGEIPAILAPALAGWLPPNVRVRETLSITVPQMVEIIAASPAPSAQSEWALLTRDVERNGPRITAVTEAHRPYRVSSAGTEAAASAFLDAEAGRGVLVVAHPTVGKESIAQLREAAVEPVERYVLEALLWWRQRNAPKATKNLRFALLEHGGAATAAALGRYAASEARMWQFLGKSAADHGTAADRLAIAQAAEQADHGALAWAMAAELGADEKLEPSGRADGLMLQLRLQPTTQPAEADDPEGFARWKAPEAALAEAEALVGADDPRVLLHRARLQGEAGDWKGALDRVVRIPEAGRTAEAHAWHARALAETGAGAAALAPLAAALASAPHDADVVGAASAVHARLGNRREAARYALIAARLDSDDAASWAAVVPAMLAAGDLPTAGLAARRAADLDPKGPDRAATLALVSALLHDQDGWSRARTLDPKVLPAVTSWPPPLSQMVELAPPEAMLAVLQQHDALVVADPALLGIRAQMRLDAGLLDEAARDGVLLAARHGQADGTALAFAATAGRLYSTTWKRDLDEAAAASPAARALRMEVALLLGTADPTTDAAGMSGDPRAAVIARLKSDAKALAAEVPGWAPDAKDPAFKAPSGCKTNARLGAAPGVAACSDAEASTATLRMVASDALPAPLHQLYTPSETGAEELPGGGRLVRLEGGAVPLFLARTRVEGDAPVDVLALGFSAESAKRALQKALE